MIRVNDRVSVIEDGLQYDAVVEEVYAHARGIEGGEYRVLPNGSNQSRCLRRCDLVEVIKPKGPGFLQRQWLNSYYRKPDGARAKWYDYVGVYVVNTFILSLPGLFLVALPALSYYDSVVWAEYRTQPTYVQPNDFPVKLWLKNQKRAMWQ